MGEWVVAIPLIFFGVVANVWTQRSLATADAVAQRSLVFHSHGTSN